MSSPTAPIADAPLDEFSNCHSGILQQLDALDRLPTLLAPAAEARRIAAAALEFFPAVVVEHHAEEERELFPAVLASATRGEERDQVQALIEQLVREHRAVEAAWEALKPQLKKVAQGHDTTLDTSALVTLVSRYREHARFEEALFLPLSQVILGRNDSHMAALGVSLHMRRALPGVMERFGHRI